MGSLVCGEDLYSNSQLVELVNNPTPDPVLCPVRPTETEKALQPKDFSWIEDIAKVPVRGSFDLVTVPLRAEPLVVDQVIFWLQSSML